LRQIVGQSGVITEPGALLVYESDGLMAYRVRPRGVVLPRNTEEVSRVVKVLWRETIPFVPRGSGTGLSGGALALEDALLVSTARMDRIIDIDVANRRARVQPGVVNVNLTASVADHGLYYAPDPFARSAATWPKMPVVRTA
jgi:glycolate oxidase